ncbi:MAG TPA: hypothetical protein PK177_14265, partial [Burkholderiaceae bacterium]|nr:hypothetical protein [Burkholderiaceae bacterium]
MKHLHSAPLLALLLGVAAPAMAATPAQKPDAAAAATSAAAVAATAVTKAESPSADATADGSLYWYDGGQRQALRLDGTQLADFRLAAKDALRPAGDVEKSVSGTLPDGVSPVLRNAGAAPG